MISHQNGYIRQKTSSSPIAVLASVIRRKTRLGERGFKKIEGVDYNETYAPVVCFRYILIRLAVVTSLKLVLHQINEETLFINGDLQKEVLMEQPGGLDKVNYNNLQI